MRGRVFAQGFTVVAMALGTYFGMKPIDRPKTYEKVLEGRGITGNDYVKTDKSKND